MNTLIPLKKTTSLLLTAFAAATLACLGLSPAVKAVSPPPDGGYPNNNTAEGTAALFSLTTGANNTAVGLAALGLNLVGSDNTAIGTGALVSNTASENTAVGALALLSTTVGTRNTAVGAGAMETGAAGNDNTAVGQLAGDGLFGASNTVLGSGSGTGITSGINNVCVGDGTGSNPATASGNIYMGHGVNPPGPGLEFYTVRIGSNLPTGAGLSQCFIGGIAGQTVNPSGAAGVYIDNDGKLGVFLSSQRFKRDVEPMNKTSEAILGLKPVTFHYKSDAKNTPCFGLIAEEVAKADPALVVRDKEGRPYSVRYDQVNAMLLNEFLKEHRTVQEQKANIAELRQNFAKQQKQIEALAVDLQKVSAQLEVSKAPTQTVLNAAKDF